MNQRSLPRSLLTSIGTSALDLGIFLLCSLHVTGALLIAARWFSGAAGALANFAVNRRWAFASRGESMRRQIPRYLLVALAAISLATLVFAALKMTTPLDLRVAHLSSMALVWLTFTYPLLNRWVFSNGKASASNS